MNEGVDLPAVIASDDIDKLRDSLRIREVARVAPRGVSGSSQIGDPFVEFVRGAVDENQRCSEFSERSGNGFTNLSFGTYAGQNDG